MSLLRKLSYREIIASFENLTGITKKVEMMKLYHWDANWDGEEGGGKIQLCEFPEKQLDRGYSLYVM